MRRMLVLLLTVTISDKQFVADRLETATTASLTIVHAFPIINVLLNALATKIWSVNKILMNQMIPAFAAFQKVINILPMLIDIWERNKGWKARWVVVEHNCLIVTFNYMWHSIENQYRISYKKAFFYFPVSHVQVHCSGKDSSVGYNFLLKSFEVGGGCLCSSLRRTIWLCFVMQLARHLCLIKSAHRQLVLPFEYVIFLL